MPLHCWVDHSQLYRLPPTKANSNGPAKPPELLSSTTLQADVFDVNSWKPHLEGAVGLVSCLGGFGSNDFMYKVWLSFMQKSIAARHDSSGPAMWTKEEQCLIECSISIWETYGAAAYKLTRTILHQADCHSSDGTARHCSVAHLAMKHPCKHCLRCSAFVRADLRGV